jgi:predicted nuclease of predicted toxin-antitoxin system
VRLKLDENLPHNLADELTRRGHDVDTVLDEQLGGRQDPVVVQAATDSDRMIFTLDRGVGDIRSFPPGSHAGVVVLRPVSQDPASILELVDRLLDAYELDEFSRCVVIVEPQRVRIRRPDEPKQR